MTHHTAPAQRRGRIIASLADVGINTGFVRAVLEGVADGETWTSPSVATGASYVRHGYGMSLIWGDRLGDAFEEVVDHLADRIGSASAGEWLQIDPRWAHLPWANALRRASPDAHIGVDTRVNFTFDPARYAHAHSGIRLQAGWTIHPADHTDYSFPGSVVPAAFWRDAAQFLTHGGGWRAQHEDIVAALAFSSFPIYDGMEIGIETLPTARRKGLGAAVAAAMIDDTLAKGLTPVWACRRGNTSSYQLAARLGFAPHRSFPCLHLPEGPNT